MNEEDHTVAALVAEGRALDLGGDIPGAIQLAQQAIRLAQILGDAEGEAQALIALAHAHLRLGHCPEARRLCQAAIERAAPDSSARIDGLLYLGTCAAETDDLTAAEEYYRQGIDLSRQMGCYQALVRGLHDISAGIYMPRGQFALSLATDSECLQIIAKRKLPVLTWGPLTTMCWVYWLTGQQDRAKAILQKLREASLPGSIGEGYWYYIQANLALEMGDLNTAQDFFTHLHSQAEDSGQLELGYLSRLGLSRLARATGRPADALAWAADALAISQRVGYHHFQAMSLIERGRAAWGLGNLDAAEADFRSAMALLAPLQLNFDLARAGLVLAALLYQRKSSLASEVWCQTATLITQAGFGFLVEQEHTLIFPLIATGHSSRDPDFSRCCAALLEVLSPPALKVTTLGSFQVWTGSRQVDPAALRQRKANALLTLLLLEPVNHCLQIEQILETLWPGRDPSAAQPLFHQASSSLRRALEPGLPEKFPSRYLIVEEGRIYLKLPPASSIDFDLFQAHCKNQRYAEAIALYQGDFLPDFRYAEWTSSTRQWLSNSFQQALLAWAKTKYREGTFSQALEACWKVLVIEPWQEQAALLAMRACVGMDDRAGARRIYLAMEETLRNELDVLPQEELRLFFNTL
jgi:DNA-binding SARP family transcriptional activator